MCQIQGIEFAFDSAAVTEQAALRDAIPFRDQVRGHEHRFTARRFGVEHFLESLAPAGIKAEPGFVEQKDGRVRQKEKRDSESLAHPTGKRAAALVRRVRQTKELEHFRGSGAGRRRADGRKNLAPEGS